MAECPFAQSTEAERCRSGLCLCHLPSQCPLHVPLAGCDETPLGCAALTHTGRLLGFPTPDVHVEGAPTDGHRAVTYSRDPTGELGTGQGVIISALHREGRRASGKLCGAVRPWVVAGHPPFCQEAAAIWSPPVSQPHLRKSRWVQGKGCLVSKPPRPLAERWCSCYDTRPFSCKTRYGPS